MYPAKNKTGHSVLKEFDRLLEEMIGLQKKEQALILERNTSTLPATSQSIEWLALKLEHMEPEVRSELQKKDVPEEFSQKRMNEKLAQIKRLAMQNHTLLEHSLFFLQQLFKQILEKDIPLQIYNLNGRPRQNDIGGGLLQARI